ncbi:hypothetical protein [Alloscardovia omnicolens]|uniref:hypothetical protein n=1 Tax=Alloscardovia omnicolens TaxID=419015 RepID=UPI003A73FED5
MKAWQSCRQRVYIGLCATLILVGLLLCAGCRTYSPSVSAPADTVSSGSVDILTPRSSNDLDPNAPLNTWNNVTHDIARQLKHHGFSEKNISHSTASTLKEQIKQLTDLVKSHSANTDKTTHILMLSPVFYKDSTQGAAIRQRYGDLVTPAVATSSLDDDSADENEQEEAQQQHAELVKQLVKAQKAGIIVVLMGQKVPDFTENYYISFSTPQSIARLQTENLVKKLQLDKATADDPQAVEMILPMNVGSEFNKSAFSASWKILKPYFVTGVAYSPSGLLDAHTTAQDWRNVTITDDSESTVSEAVYARLNASKKSYAHIDGILAFTDHTAHGVVAALKSMGYTGSSAMINPEITLESIVKTLSGNADVNKQRIPRPSPITSDKEYKHTSSSPSSAQNTLSWPIITSFGVYISDLPDVINGKIWISSMEDRAALSESVASLCTYLVKGLTGSQLENKVPHLTSTTLTTPLFAVTADNVKKTLLDTGYITPADAGL